MVTVYDLEQLSDDGKTYYNIVLNLATGEYFMIKNSGCTAHIEHWLEEKYNIKNWEVGKIFKIFFNKNDDFINLENVYKKYHKYFKK